MSETKCSNLNSDLFLLELLSSFCWRAMFLILVYICAISFPYIWSIYWTVCSTCACLHFLSLSVAWHYRLLSADMMSSGSDLLLPEGQVVNCQYMHLCTPQSLPCQYLKPAVSDKQLTSSGKKDGEWEFRAASTLELELKSYPWCIPSLSNKHWTCAHSSASVQLPC